MGESLLLGASGALVVLVYVYLKRVVSGADTRFWLPAWVSLWLCGTLLHLGAESRAVDLLVHAAGDLFAFFVVVAGLRFSGRPTPVWIFAVAVAVAAVRATSTALALRPLNYAVVAAVEAPAIAFTGFAIGVHAVRSRAASAERLLGPMVVALAALCFVDAYFRARSVDPVFLSVPWVVVPTLAAMLQLFAAVERIAARERQLRREHDLLRGIAEEATRPQDVPELARRLLQRMERVLGCDRGALWLDDEPGDGRLAAFGAVPQRPPEADEPGGTEESPLVAVLRVGGVDRPTGVLLLGWSSAAARPLLGPTLLERTALAVGIAVRHRRAVRDAEDRRRELESERRTLHSVLRNAPVGICVVDRELRILVGNHVAAGHLGAKDADALAGTRLDELFLAARPRVRDASELGRALALGSHDPSLSFENLEVVVKGDPERIFLIHIGPVFAETGDPVGWIVVTQDVTETRRLERNLRHTQKLETLGTLAAGIAHDFNNQLTAILGNAELLAVESGAGRREALEALTRAAEHCADLTRGLLAFSRKGVVRAEPMDVGRVVRDAASLARATLPPSIELAVSVDEDLPAARIDATELKQVVLNLVTNARDSIQDRGRIELRAGRRADEPKGSGPLERGSVEISVRDDGSGIPPELHERILDPFFTTKEPSRGTGLGLAIAFGVLRSNGGRLEFESRVGGGSIFRAVLPAIADETASRPEPPRSRSKPAPGAGTILVVDDHAQIRRVARSALERAGYRVLLARDGDEAIARFGREGTSIDLALVDLSMPGRSGQEVIAALREAAPGLPVVLMSGVPDAMDVPLPDGASRLAKPFHANELAEAVRRGLQRSRPPA